MGTFNADTPTNELVASDSRVRDINRNAPEIMSDMDGRRSEEAESKVWSERRWLQVVEKTV